MSPEGLLNNGKLELQRDVQPLIEEMKAKWKGKIQEIQGLREGVSQELVQNDLLLRNLEEERKKLAKQLDETLSFTTSEQDSKKKIP